MKTAIVAAADANYFSYLTELLDSIERAQKESGVRERMDVCVLDIGMNAGQLAQLGKRVARIVALGVDD